jgi:hypothetical protein
VSTYEEWRVTGTDDDGRRINGTWILGLNNDPEPEARTYASWARTQGWTDGPHLHKRTVTVTEWTEVDA